MIKNVYWSSCKVPHFYRQILMKVNFLDRFSINNEISSFMKILPMGTELFHAERRTDGEAEANSRFSQICKGAKKISI